MQARRGTVIERMRQWNLGLNPFEAESLQRKRLEKRRPGSQWMNCRTNIVHKSRPRELSRACASANGRVRFTNEHGTTRARECDRGCQTIRPRAHYDGIVFNRHVEKVEPLVCSSSDYLSLRNTLP